MHSIQAASARPLKAPPQLTAGQGLLGTAGQGLLGAEKSPVEKAEEVREAFTEFIGQTFFNQMLKAMRSSVGKPAYFHGGRAEEVFQSQLDQTLADEMTKASADKLANPLFERQFPRHAAALKEDETLDDLKALRRR